MEKTVQKGTKQYVIFRLGQEEYGIEIQKVQIIERIASITRVPKAPYFIKGVINQRGEIIPVMSLRLKFNLVEEEYTDESRIIIVRMEEDSIGMIVDEVKEVLEFSQESIENIQGFASEVQLNFIQGVGKVNERIVTLLNLKVLIDVTLEETKENIKSK